MVVGEGELELVNFFYYESKFKIRKNKKKYCSGRLEGGVEGG